MANSEGERIVQEWWGQWGVGTLLLNDANTDLPGGSARVPKPPCLSGSRSTTESLLTWKAPDNGGADITNYKIYRSNLSGGEVLLGQTSNASTTFRDQNPTSDTHLFYRVTAVNSAGDDDAPKRRKLSAAARKRIAAAQKKRWAEHRKALAQAG